MSDGVERRFTFNQIAQLYSAARPSYPDALFDDCIREAGLESGDRMLEVGAGTGKPRKVSRGGVYRSSQSSPARR